MAFYVFASGKDPKQFAVSADPSAPRLPLDREPWTLKRMERICSRVDYLDIAMAEADIQADGFDLCRDIPDVPSSRSLRPMEGR